MRNDRHQLRKELRQVGADGAEVDALLAIATGMRLLRQDQVAPAQRDRTSSPLQRISKPAAFAASGLVLGMLLVILSQSALPTSVLYPVQRLSDSIAINAYPQYRAAVMMRRAQQVNQLVAERASSPQVLAALADYRLEASVYKAMPHANYAAFEFCKTNLEQAASSTDSAQLRQAISSTLQSLETT